jgi:hypothetical protein
MNKRVHQTPSKAMLLYLFADVSNPAIPACDTYLPAMSLQMLQIIHPMAKTHVNPDSVNAARIWQVALATTTAVDPGEHKQIQHQNTGSALSVEERGASPPPHTKAEPFLELVMFW